MKLGCFKIKPPSILLFMYALGFLWFVLVAAHLFVTCVISVISFGILDGRDCWSHHVSIFDRIMSKYR